jgi:CheY-like chemotaxis protein
MSLGTLVIAEDDATLRMMITTILQKAGFTVMVAADGAEAWELIQSVRPSLVVSDVQMPHMDGVELLSRIRADADLSTTPLILLTSLAERAHMRAGMSSGADDYLTKPFVPQDLVDAVTAQLRKHASRSARVTKTVQVAVKTALDNQRHNLATVYERRLRKELGGSMWQAEASARDEVFEEASVLCVDLVGDTWPQLLSTSELSEVLKLAYTNANDAVSLFGARSVQMIGEGLVAVFVPSGDTASMTHRRRAMKSAIALGQSAVRVRRHLEQRYPQRKLPEFELSVAVHSGPVTLAHMTDSLNMERPTLMPAGPSIKMAMLMQREAALAGMNLIASRSALDGLAGEVRLGRRAQMDLRAGEGIYVAEILQWAEPATQIDSTTESDSSLGELSSAWGEDGQTLPMSLEDRPSLPTRTRT